MLATYVLPRWRSGLALLVFLLIGVGLELLGPFVLARFVDSALAGEPLRELLTLAVFFLVLASLTQLGTVAKSYFATNLGFKANNDLRADLALILRV
jgi:ATP-binding cassette, subfamily B, bacterial